MTGKIKVKGNVRLSAPSISINGIKINLTDRSLHTVSVNKQIMLAVSGFTIKPHKELLIYLAIFLHL